MWQVANQRGYTCQGTWMWKAIWEVDVAVPIVDISAFNEDKWHLFSKKEKKKVTSKKLQITLNTTTIVIQAQEEKDTCELLLLEPSNTLSINRGLIYSKKWNYSPLINLFIFIAL